MSPGARLCPATSRCVSVLRDRAIGRHPPLYDSEGIERIAILRDDTASLDFVARLAAMQPARKHRMLPP
jgi:hypothetical protein